MSQGFLSMFVRSSDSHARSEGVWCAQPAVLPQVWPCEVLLKALAGGESFCSSVNQRGLCRDVKLRGNILTTRPPPATRNCADNLLDKGNNSRLVVIQTAEMKCFCVGLAAGGKEEEACSPLPIHQCCSSPPRGNSVHTAAPLDCEITVSRVWTVMHADVLLCCSWWSLEMSDVNEVCLHTWGHTHHLWQNFNGSKVWNLRSFKFKTRKLWHHNYQLHIFEADIEIFSHLFHY